MSTKKISNTTQRSYIVEHFVAMNSAIFEMNKALMDDDRKAEKAIQRACHA